MPQTPEDTGDVLPDADPDQEAQSAAERAHAERIEGHGHQATSPADQTAGTPTDGS